MTEHEKFKAECAAEIQQQGSDISLKELKRQILPNANLNIGQI